METAGRRVVVVCGMHRAGTSVVARGLQALGADLGDSLMSADARMNARGFFEDTDIVALNDALLEAWGADWKSVATLIDSNWDAPGPGCPLDAATKLLARKVSPPHIFAFKDPRIARLLPFWQRVFANMELADAYVIAVRHPKAVIDSLAARDQLDPRRSAWLWVVHLLCALRYTQRRSRVIVDYDRVMDSPAYELERIAAAIRVPANGSRTAEIDSFCREFLSAELRHAQYSEHDLAGIDLVPLGAETHALALRLAVGEAPSDDDMREIDTLFERLCSFVPALAYAGSVEALADQLPRLAGELDWAHGSIDKASAYNESLQVALATARTYNDSLVQTLARKESELIDVKARLERVNARFLGRILLRRIEREGNH